MREYWIIDPQESVTVYDFAHERVLPYSMKELIPVNLWDGFGLDFSKMDFQ